MTAVEEETGLTELPDDFKEALAKIPRMALPSYQDAAAIWHDGFMVGRAEGRSLGSSLVKLEVHATIDVLDKSGAISRDVATTIRDALDAVIGRRLPR